MEDNLESKIEGRLKRIEAQLKVIQFCLYVLLGWVILMSTPIGTVMALVTNIVVVTIAIAVIVVVPFVWAVSYYQDWKAKKEKECRVQMDQEFPKPPPQPSGGETD